MFRSYTCLFSEKLDFTWGNVNVELSVFSPWKDKCCITSKSFFFFSHSGERDRERQGETEIDRERERCALWGNESKGFEE